VYAQQVAYTLTARAPGASNLTAKNCVWDFFANSNKPRPANRRQSPQPRRKIRPTPTKNASGIPYWPSRDPIGENWNTGEYNEYAFIKNGPVDSIDVLGYSQLWTASGIGNYSGGEFHDYVGETLKDAGINPDHSERSALGVGMHYLRGGWVGTPLSEEQLDGEAENKANNANYCPAKGLCKKKICVVMVACCGPN
jgi:hypothetical protein